MIVINLWGGPGSGKTTTASALFSLLRHRWNTNTELVTEFATDLCFEQARENLKNQVYLLGNQYHRLWRLSQIGVDVVVTDAPIGLNDVYSAIYKQPYQDEMRSLIKKLTGEFEEINILMLRDPTAVGGFKGGSKKGDARFIKKFDQAMAEYGPVMDYTVHYSIAAPEAVIDCLGDMTSADGPIKESFWKQTV